VSQRQAEVESVLEQVATLESRLTEREAQLVAHEGDIAAAIANDRQQQTEELELLGAEVTKRSDTVEKEAHALLGQAERLREREAEVEAGCLPREQNIAAQEQQLIEREGVLAESESAFEEQQLQNVALEKERSERDNARDEDFARAQEEARGQAADSLHAAEAVLRTRAEELDT
jgi:hypothetical protein